MRQLVHENQTGLARQRGVQVEFGQALSAVINLRRRQQRQAFEQGRRLTTAMGLHDPGHHVNAIGEQLARRHQHGVGLANSR